MTYSIKKSFIQVIGKIWMPAITCAMDYNLSYYDVKSLGKPTRESIEDWLSKHSGDFQSIEDFRADIELPNGENIVIEWEKEESEYTYNDCMFPVED